MAPAYFRENKNNLKVIHFAPGEPSQIFSMPQPPKQISPPGKSLSSPGTSWLNALGTNQFFSAFSVYHHQIIIIHGKLMDINIYKLLARCWWMVPIEIVIKQEQN